MAVVDLICLANSYKNGCRCIAGLRVDRGGWVRPVSGRPEGELEPRHYLLDDGSEPGLLDVLYRMFSIRRNRAAVKTVFHTFVSVE